LPPPQRLLFPYTTLFRSQVEKITAFLFHRGSDNDPERLVANAGKSFIGSYVLGMGFTFDDTDTNGIATPIAEMRRIIAKDPRNRSEEHTSELQSPYDLVC